MYTNKKYISLWSLIIILFVSCQTDTSIIENPSESSDFTLELNVDSDSDSDSNSKPKNESKTNRAVNGSKYISFNRPNGPYTRNHANNDFGNSNEINNAELSRLSTNNGNLRVLLKRNSTGSTGGQFAKHNIQKSNHYILKYKVKFPGNFQWSKGGKLPGLGGGTTYSGCSGNQANSNGNGWTSRIMFRKENSTNPWFQPYIYYKGMPGRCGYNFNKKINITKNTWYNVRMEVKMNSGNNTNGLLDIRINGQVLYRNTNFRWVSKNSGREIDKLLTGIYRGGNDSRWHASIDNHILFDHIQLIKK